MHRYRYYQCGTCNAPYFGGERAVSESPMCPPRAPLVTSHPGDLARPSRPFPPQHVCCPLRSPPPLLVQCGVLEVEEGFNKKDLVCGQCSLASGGGGCGASVCPKHGADYIEFKCKFCCSVAVRWSHVLAARGERRGGGGGRAPV
jgi:hypothetical protein